MLRSCFITEVTSYGFISCSNSSSSSYLTWEMLVIGTLWLFISSMISNTLVLNSAAYLILATIHFSRAGYFLIRLECQLTTAGETLNSFATSACFCFSTTTAWLILMTSKTESHLCTYLLRWEITVSSKSSGTCLLSTFFLK